MAKQTGKPATPTADDWRRVIANFKRNRDLDRTLFHERAEQLVAELVREANKAEAEAGISVAL